MANDARGELVRFLDRKVFEPILHAGADRYGERDRERLERVKANTESERKRFHEDYRSAKEVRDNYHADLSSRTADRVNRDLEKLGLPTLPSVKDEFDALSARLGVE
jgi:hypothetical protein